MPSEKLEWLIAGGGCIFRSSRVLKSQENFAWQFLVSAALATWPPTSCLIVLLLLVLHSRSLRNETTLRCCFWHPGPLWSSHENVAGGPLQTLHENSTSLLLKYTPLRAALTLMSGFLNAVASLLPTPQMYGTPLSFKKKTPNKNRSWSYSRTLMHQLTLDRYCSSRQSVNAHVVFLGQASVAIAFV